ncbi:MAG: IS21-like element helper ATPase IstB [Deltaproteobacteria bacterium]|nr:IS21-like element helper ATPase IstB [Deltaproteobacteria bacterium]
MTAIDSVKTLTHKLRLHGFHNAVEPRLAQAQGQDLDHTEFLRLLLEDENLFRRSQVTKRLISRAKFRAPADLEDWDMSFDRGLPKGKMNELAQGAFHHAGQNLIILGKTGEGKTHLAQAVGRRLCQNQIRVSFVSISLLMEEIQSQKIAGRYLVFIRNLNRAGVLIFDDWGLRNYTHEEATFLVDILEERYRKGTVIVTSQVDPKGWLKLFEDPVIAEAIVDRLVNPSQKIMLKGGSYRERLGLPPKPVELKQKVK